MRGINIIMYEGTLFTSYEYLRIIHMMIILPSYLRNIINIINRLLLPLFFMELLTARTQRSRLIRSLAALMDPNTGRN